MAFTCGFFNSKDGDRKYNAEDVSRLFDGFIVDGVIASIGDTFKVTADGTGTTVTVATGRAWFDHTWNYNDAPLVLDCGDAPVLQNRWDAVVLEVNNDPTVRENSIKIVVGEENSSAVKPTMTDSEYVHQYPLAYVYREATTTTIIQANITNCVGTSECPLATAVLEGMSADQFLAQWQSEVMTWYENISADTETDLAGFKASWDAWFADIKGTLSDDAATALYDHLSTISIELPVDGWSDTAPYTQTVTFASMKSTYNYGPMYVDPVGVQATDEANNEALACISYMTTADGSITAVCYEDKPTTTVTVKATRRIDA